MAGWEEITQSIQSQIEKNGTKSLFYNFGSEQGVSCSDKNYFLLLNARQDVLRFIQEIEDKGRFDFFIEILSKYVMDVFFRANQYLAGDKDSLKKAGEVYKRFVCDIRKLCEKKAVSKNDIDELFSAHYDRLRLFLSEYNGQSMLQEYTKAPQIIPKVCSQYSPQRQMKLLDLETEKIIGPVMDIGCGKDAGLVKYLRQNGIEAYGIDRDAEQNEFLFSGDYLDFDFGIKTYGTIVSHMAFSNQLWYLMQKGSSQLEKYQRKYDMILNALKTGGCFIYTPGLPRLEQALGKEFILEKSDIVYKDSRFYTAKIFRRAGI